MSFLDHDIQQIHNEWRVLQDRWREASENWRDPVQERFSREFWQEIENIVSVYLVQAQETSEAISKVFRDLGRV